MGARGKLKLVDEHPAAPKGTAAAVVPPIAPRKPSGVEADPELSALWDEVVPELDRTGLLSPADVVAVEVFLRHVLMVRLAHRGIVESGSVTAPASDTDIEKKHPAEVILRLESAMAMEWAKQLGMTWMTRARTPAAPRGARSSPFAYVPPDDDNPFAYHPPEE